MPARRHFGSVRKLRSGRYQASYWHDVTRHIAPDTFTTKGEAYAWLSTVDTDILKGAWISPSAGTETFGDYARPGWPAASSCAPGPESSIRIFLTSTCCPRFAT